MKNIAPEEARRWLNGLAEFNNANRNIALSLFAITSVPKTFLDVGCGNGMVVETARALGANAHGIDILPLDKPYFHQADLSEPIDLGFAVDIITSIEVAEHIEPEGADNFCDTLAKHLNPGGLLVLTAAPPGQPGDGHVNCQPAEYWRKRMYDRGLIYNAAQTWRIALAWSIAEQPMHWLESNLQVFVK